MPKLSNKLFWVPGMERWVELALGIPSIPIGTPLSLLMEWVNDQAVSVQGHVDLTITKPDGSQVSLPAVVNQDKSALPGKGLMVQFAPVPLDQIGNYRADAFLDVQAALPQLWDGIVWIVNAGDSAMDWSLDFEFLSDSQTLGSASKQYGWRRDKVSPLPQTAPPPYTWVPLLTFATPQEVSSIKLRAVDNFLLDRGFPSVSVFLFFYKPPGLEGGQPLAGQSPARSDINMTGRTYIYEPGPQEVILGI